MRVNAQPRRRAVSITGLGSVSCLGASTNALWQNTLKNLSGIESGLGRVRESDLNVSSEVRSNRALAFCVQAIDETMANAGWTSLNDDDGLLLATTTGQLLKWDSVFTEFINGRASREDFRGVFGNQPLGALLKSVGQYYDHEGPTSLLTSACSASTQALGIAAMWLRQGRVKRCLVVGVEVLCDLTCEGFRSLHLLSNAPARPFDQTRQGINLSEGAAALCLETASDRPLAELSGFGFSTDGFHMTGPHPEGEGSFRAMQQALKVAGLSPDEVTWVHAHGTGSIQNDLAEGFAVSRLFANHRPWVSSTKWLHGHALGASGALETVLVVRAMREDTVLCTRGLNAPDPAIPVRHPDGDLKISIRHVLKNTLGFGGTNAALLISRPGEAP